MAGMINGINQMVSFFICLITAALFGDIAWADELKTVPPRENDLTNEREGE